MIIKEVLAKLETSENPIAKSLHTGNGYNVLVMAFKKGMVLKEHKAHIPSKFTVLAGSVKYIEENRTVELNQYDDVDIPVDVPHSVEAVEDSLCLLSQGE